MSRLTSDSVIGPIPLEAVSYYPTHIGPTLDINSKNQRSTVEQSEQMCKL